MAALGDPAGSSEVGGMSEGPGLVGMLGVR